MADKVVKRGVSIYIDGQAVVNSVKQIKAEMSKLTNEQAKMTIGSDEYVAHAGKIGYLKTLQLEHIENQKQITKEYIKNTDAAKAYDDQNKVTLGSLPGVFGQIQNSAVSAFKAVQSKMNDIIGTSKNIVASLFEYRAARKAATLAEEAAVVAETALRDAVAIGAATDTLAAEAELARAAATTTATTATTMGAAALKIFKFALASTGIGLILVALGLLVTYFNSTNEGAKKLKQITAGLGVYFQEFLKFTGQLGKALFQAFYSPIDAINSLKEAFSNLSFKTMNEHSKAAVQIEKDKQKLQKQEREWQSEQIRMNGEIDVLEKKGSKQSALSGKEKKAALEAAKKMRLEMYNTDLKFAKENERIVNKEQSLNSKKDMQAIQDAKNRTAQLIADKNNRLQGLQNKEDKATKGIVSEDAAKQAKEKKASDALLQEIENTNLKNSAAIKKQYVDGEIKTEFEYNQKLLAESDRYDTVRKAKIAELLDVKKKGHVTDLTLRLELQKQVSEIDKKNLDRQIDQNNKIKKILLDADPIKAEKESYDNRLRELGIYNVEESAMTAEQLNAKRILQEQHNETMRKLSTKDAVVQLKQLERDQEDAEKTLSIRRASERMTDQIYKDEQLKIELDFLKKKLAIAGLSADEIDKISKQLNQKGIDQTNKSYDEMSNFLSKYGIDELDKYKTQKETELKILQDALDKGILSEKDAANVRNALASEEFKLKTKNLTKWASAAAKFAGDISNTAQGFQQAEEKSIDLKYQKQIDAAKKAGQDTTEIEENKNKELAELRAKNADAMFALQVAQIIASTAVSAIDAYASALTIPVVGLVAAPVAAAAAVAYGASQIAVANSAREAAKAGYSSGGFTPNVGKYEPTGVVHGGEFVASQEAVRNSQLRPILNAIDAAQRNGTVSSLSRDQLTKALGGGSVSTTASPARQTVTSTASEPANNDYMAAVLERNAQAMERLNKHIDNGISANVSIHGKNGISENTILYDKLKANATR